MTLMTQNAMRLRVPSDDLVPAERAIRRYLVAGVSAVMMLAAGMGGLSATTELSGAVIAQGVFVVDSHVKKVQHPTGGIIGVLNVRDGDHVDAGELLARLDDTQTRASLAIVTRRLDEFAARRARIEAERDERDKVDFPGDLKSRTSDPVVASLLASETRLFELRRSARAGQKEQLRSRIGQLEKEHSGLVVQEEAKAEEIRLINEELSGIRSLWDKKLIPLQRIMASERDAARLGGERGQLVAAEAQTQGKISETKLQIIQIDQDMRSEVAKELREIEAQNSEYVERKVAAEDQLKHIDITAPQSGVVHQLSIHTIGGVVSAGEPIMLIVPVSDALRVEVKIAPQDIDQIQAQQIAHIRLSAFNQRVTPEINGVVEEISPDLTQDQKSGASYYTARIRIDPDEIARLKGLKIVPGMPAEVFIQTSSRTMLSFLVKPLRDQIERAFRED